MTISRGAALGCGQRASPLGCALLDICCGARTSYAVSALRMMVADAVCGGWPAAEVTEAVRALTPAQSPGGWAIGAFDAPEGVCAPSSGSSSPPLA